MALTRLRATLSSLQSTGMWGYETMKHLTSPRYSTKMTRLISIQSLSTSCRSSTPNPSNPTWRHCQKTNPNTASTSSHSSGLQLLTDRLARNQLLDPVHQTPLIATAEAHPLILTKPLQSTVLDVKTRRDPPLNQSMCKLVQSVLYHSPQSPTIMFPLHVAQHDLLCSHTV